MDIVIFLAAIISASGGVAWDLHASSKFKCYDNAIPLSGNLYIREKNPWFRNKDGTANTKKGAIVWYSIIGANVLIAILLFYFDVVTRANALYSFSAPLFIIAVFEGRRGYANSKSQKYRRQRWPERYHPERCK